MILGLDVGGTHTDAVIVGDDGIVASYKTVTDHDNLLASTSLAIREVMNLASVKTVDKINLSTTLSTNAIVQNKTERTGVIVSSGPGIKAENFSPCGDFYEISGSIDHRGVEQKRLNKYELKAAFEDLKQKGIKVFSAVTKFSTRNPDHENIIKEEIYSLSDYSTAGHLLSGALSFPRRVATAYYNSAVWRLFNRFADSIHESLELNEGSEKINILKADGGTMPLEVARNFPVESILSGPAASVMGILALSDISEDSIIIDIGGTTSDVAVFAGGSPIIERTGISINGNPTLVRALMTKSFGIGGDSSISINNSIIETGPERKGPAMAEGGKCPTLVDALNYTGKINFGDKDRSIEGIKKLADENSIDPENLASRAVDFAVDKIKTEIDAMLTEINLQPVYTLREMLHGDKIVPEKIYIMGGPAEGMAPLLKESFSLETVVPDNFNIANALGAALARTTVDIELFADTGRKQLLVPALNIKETISSGYSLSDAEADAEAYLRRYLEKIGVHDENWEIEIVHSSSFRMIDGFYSSGNDIRVRCQVKPGTVKTLYAKGGSR